MMSIKRRGPSGSSPKRRLSIRLAGASRDDSNMAWNERSSAVTPNDAVHSPEAQHGGLLRVNELGPRTVIKAEQVKGYSDWRECYCYVLSQITGQS